MTRMPKHWPVKAGNRVVCCTCLVIWPCRAVQEQIAEAARKR